MGFMVTKLSALTPAINQRRRDSFIRHPEHVLHSSSTLDYLDLVSFPGFRKAREMKTAETDFGFNRLLERKHSRLRWMPKSGSMLQIAFQGGRRMKKPLAFLAVGCFALGIAALLSWAQSNKALRPSPPAKATCELAEGKTITVDYSSPRAKGRKIFGGLVPYGEVWRAGANEATTFVTTADLMVGASHVPAGSYTLFAIPNKDKWTLIISKKTGE